MSVINIGIFGRRNVGKSSLINLLCGEDVAIVSHHPGTTTDVVRKRIELPSIGKCNLIDTAGVDDDGDLGLKRVERSLKMVNQVDLALLLFSGNIFAREELSLLKHLKKNSVPTILVHNQSDIIPLDPALSGDLMGRYGVDIIEFSCADIDEESRKSEIALLLAYLEKGLTQIEPYRDKGMFDGIRYVSKGKRVLLVCPIDSEAPVGRLILPQVKAIRELLDIGAIVTIIQPENLEEFLSSNPAPHLVVTDSQAFRFVHSTLPNNIPLTSFSVLLAKSRGCYHNYLEGTPKISALKDGDKVLILESCSHHSSCEDIGRVKLPALFSKYSGKSFEFDVVPGMDSLPADIEKYALVVQCGGCVITSKQLYLRLKGAIDKGVPVTNYGMAIAYMNGIPLSVDGIREGE